MKPFPNLFLKISRWPNLRCSWPRAPHEICLTWGLGVVGVGLGSGFGFNYRCPTLASAALRSDDDRKSTGNVNEPFQINGSIDEDAKGTFTRSAQGFAIIASATDCCERSLLDFADETNLESDPDHENEARMRYVEYNHPGRQRRPTFPITRS